MDPNDADESASAEVFNHAVDLAPIDNRPTVQRLSMEEDYLYEQVMTFARPPNPPAYHVATHGTYSGPTRKGKAAILDDGLAEQEVLPNYYCDVHMENVFQMKMEIEEAVKRAEYRNWRTMFVVLHGTALHIYSAKEKGWGFGKSRRHGPHGPHGPHVPHVTPDMPPWLRKGTLERSYSLQHADVGIAADYHKRRYVIRIRAETDQFLISCVELETFVKWLECLFASIDVAAPIDERDFPRDQSIPRIQRLRWLRGQYSAQATSNNGNFQPLAESMAPVTASHIDSDIFPVDPPPEADMSPPGGPGVDDAHGAQAPGQNAHVGRPSTRSHPSEEDIEPETGKWHPRHFWTSTHDMVYAKLCYAVLLFKSPRKSNFVIFKGQRWHIDWSTGQMSRVQPPSYGEPEFWGPWQVIHAERRRL